MRRGNAPQFLVFAWRRGLYVDDVLLSPIPVSPDFLEPTRTIPGPPFDVIRKSGCGRGRGPYWGLLKVIPLIFIFFIQKFLVNILIELFEGHRVVPYPTPSSRSRGKIHRKVEKPGGWSLLCSIMRMWILVCFNLLIVGIVWVPGVFYTFHPILIGEHL